jgi:hypothetical protein
MQSVYCSSCGKPNAPDAKFCNGCAQAIIQSPTTHKPIAPNLTELQGSTFWAKQSQTNRLLYFIVALACLLGLVFAISRSQNKQKQISTAYADPFIKPTTPSKPAEQPTDINPNPEVSNTESASKWHGEESVSEMDNSKGYFVLLRAENEVKGWMVSYAPVLSVRCKERKIELIIDIGMPANVEYGGGHTVRIKLDDAAPIKQKWSESTNNKALFCESDIVGLSKKIAQSQTLKFEFVPFNGSPQVVQFDVRGFRQHLDKILETCKKK